MLTRSIYFGSRKIKLGKKERFTTLHAAPYKSSQWGITTITSRTKKDKNSCNVYLRFWQKRENFYGFPEPYLIATPSAGEWGTELLDAHNLSHVLVRGVTGHQVMIGKLVFFHCTWKYGFTIIFFLWNGNKILMYKLFPQKSSVGTKDKPEKQQNRSFKKCSQMTLNLIFKWMKNPMTHITLGLQSFSSNFQKLSKISTSNLFTIL